MKFCVECKHYDIGRSECARPGDLVLSLVNGKPVMRVPTDAWHERYTESDNTCGKKARFFDGK